MRCSLALPLLALLLGRAYGGVPTMWLQNVTDVDPLAVCNDGSPSGYYFVPGSTQADVWLVYLEGGMWCYDQFSCNYRFKNAGYSMSSKTWKDSFKQGGIFEDNAVKSPIAGANKIFVTYCSSDAWVGDGEMYGYQFRGARIVEAVLTALVQKQGLGAGGAPQKLIFGGCSAGGRGAAFSLDYVPAILEAAGASTVGVYGLFDAGLWIDIPPAVAGIVSQQCQTAALAQMVNATQRLGAACALAYPGLESWKCLYGQYRMPFIQTPYILQASQLDTFQIEININAGGAMLAPTTPDDFAFAQRFQTAAKAVIATLPTASQPGSGIFSPACFHHCVTDAAGFWGLSIGGQSFEDVFADWFIRGVTPQHVVDACSGWRCGTCSTKRSHKGGKLKPGHGARSPAQLLAAQLAAGNASALAPPAPGHPDPWGWSPAQSAALSPPPPEVCTQAGLVYAQPPAEAPAAAVAATDAFRGGASATAPTSTGGSRSSGGGFGSNVGSNAPTGGAVALPAVRRSGSGSATVSAAGGARLTTVVVAGTALPLGALCLWRSWVRPKRAISSAAERRTLL